MQLVPLHDGLLKPGLGIYVTTAANPTESSWWRSAR
jgi:hypothetical protein